MVALLMGLDTEETSASLCMAVLVGVDRLSFALGCVVHPTTKLC